MSFHKGRAWTGLALIALVAVLAGCSSTPPPCEVDQAQIDQAKTSVQAAQDEVEQAKGEVDDLTAELADLEGDLVSDEEIARMEDHLYELKKGSGR
mgnify:CR=1 FL=1